MGAVAMKPTRLPESDVTAASANLPSYSETRDSGVEWLAIVPAHWEVRRVKEWLRVNQTVLPDDTDPGYEFNYLDISAVQAGRLVADPKRLKFGSSPSRARRVVRAGDTIVSTVRPYLNAVWHVDEQASDLVASTGFAVLTPQAETESAFVGYLCRSQPFVDSVTARSAGVAYPAIPETHLAALAVAVPPLAEQTAIVRFLDYVDRRTHRYIRTKEKLTALLEEQKQAVIHRAVTGQIDVRTGRPYPAYKDSRVEWLRTVPEHWIEMVLGKAATSIQTGPFGSQLHANEYADYGVPVINPSHLTQGRIAPDHSVAVTERKATVLSRHRFAPGDIVMARRGDVGRSALVHSHEAGWICGTGSLRIRPRRTVCVPGYLLLVLNSSESRNALDLASVGSTMSNLNAEIVSRLRIRVPPLPEQLAIADFCTRVTDRHTAAADQARRQIDFLREFRTCLFADVVTGKLDVREAAATPPEVDPFATKSEPGTPLDSYAG